MLKTSSKNQPGKPARIFDEQRHGQSRASPLARLPSRATNSNSSDDIIKPGFQNIHQKPTGEVEALGWSSQLSLLSMAELSSFCSTVSSHGRAPEAGLPRAGSRGPRGPRGRASSFSLTADNFYHRMNSSNVCWRWLT